jgi:hypothetical protein
LCAATFTPRSVDGALAGRSIRLVEIRWTPRRCLLAQISRPSFVEGGGSVGFDAASTGATELKWPVELPVVAEGAEHVRAVVEDDDARLFVFLRREDLSTVILVRTVVAPAPESHDGRGPWLAPGVDVRGLISTAALSPIESYCGCCGGGVPLRYTAARIRCPLGSPSDR